MAAPILIIGVGNESRGDDALGPLLLRRLERWLKTPPQPERFELIEEFQLQVEHATDLAGRELVLFIDAGMDTPAPYTFRRASASASRTLFSHALSPEAVHSTYAQIYGQTPPPSFVLCIRGEQFELGSALTPAAAAHLELAENFLCALLQDPELAAWEALSCSRIPAAATARS